MPRRPTPCRGSTQQACTRGRQRTRCQWTQHEGCLPTTDADADADAGPPCWKCNRNRCVANAARCRWFPAKGRCKPRTASDAPTADGTGAAAAAPTGRFVCLGPPLKPSLRARVSAATVPDDNVNEDEETDEITHDKVLGTVRYRTATGQRTLFLIGPADDNDNGDGDGDGDDVGDRVLSPDHLTRWLQGIRTNPPVTNLTTHQHFALQRLAVTGPVWFLSSKMWHKRDDRHDSDSDSDGDDSEARDPPHALCVSMAELGFTRNATDFERYGHAYRSTLDRQRTSLRMRAMVFYFLRVCARTRYVQIPVIAPRHLCGSGVPGSQTDVERELWAGALAWALTLDLFNHRFRFVLLAFPTEEDNDDDGWDEFVRVLSRAQPSLCVSVVLDRRWVDLHTLLETYHAWVWPAHPLAVWSPTPVTSLAAGRLAADDPPDARRSRRDARRHIARRHTANVAQTLSRYTTLSVLERQHQNHILPPFKEISPRKITVVRWPSNLPDDFPERAALLA